MAAACAELPSGKVSKALRTDAARQGAYDFIESRAAHAAGLLESSQRACAVRARQFPYVLVPLDGTSLSLVDRRRVKDFGSVGSRGQGARGLKVVDAIGLAPDGTPLGLAAMEWWARGPKASKRHKLRNPKDRESKHWVDAVMSVTTMLDAEAPDTKAWFQVDREGDALPLLMALTESGHDFTVRSNGTRRLWDRCAYLKPHIARRPANGHVLVELPRTAQQPARPACMAVRFASVTLRLRNDWTKVDTCLAVQVVHVREYGSVAAGQKRVEWLLLTSRSVRTLAEAEAVVVAYSMRWRIEEFHKTWKSGVCDVESTQLRAKAHVITWATMLAAVAVRVERLKHLSREQPDSPASEALSAAEIRALILLKRKYKKRTEEIPDSMPTLADATLWLAQLGGYTGKSSGGPPGSITIGRGLEQLRSAAAIIELLEPAKAKAKKR